MCCVNAKSTGAGSMERASLFGVVALGCVLPARLATDDSGLLP